MRLLIVHLRIRHALRSGVSVRPATRSVLEAKCGWGALNSLGYRLRGIPDGLTTQYLSNLLIVEPATDVADYEPWPRSILKRPQWGV